MVRGGSFNNNDNNVRAANRNRNNPTDRNNNIGFRVVVSRSPHRQKSGSDAPRAWLARRGGEQRSPFLAVSGRRIGQIATAPNPGSGLVRGASLPFWGAAVFDSICSWSNLLLAYQRAAKGKRGQTSVAAFEYRLEDNLVGLRQSLESGTYQPGRYTNFLIHEPKRRLISAAPFRDRVVHHALCNVIEPVFDRTFVKGSFANRKGKGTHRALNVTQRMCRRHLYVLQCDIQQFFPSLDHAVLRRCLLEKIDDARVMRLVDRILASGETVHQDYEPMLFPGDDLLSLLRPRGLPIGNLTSQFWANVYMNPFDQFVNRELRCSAYVRYVDDLLLFADDKPTLWRWHAAVVERLDRFRLRLHPEAQPRPVAEGIPFLGFIVFPERRRLKPRKGLHFRRRLAQLLLERSQRRRTVEEVGVRVRGWVNHMRYANSMGLRKAVFRDAVRLAAAGVSRSPRSTGRGPGEDLVAQVVAGFADG